MARRSMAGKLINVGGVCCRFCLIAIIVIFALWLATVVRFRSWKGAIGYAQGFSPHVVAGSVKLVDLQPGQETTLPLRLTNVSRSPIEVLGGNSDCGCVVVQDLPLRLEPGEYRDVPVAVAAPGKEGVVFSHRVLFYLNAEGPPAVARISGSVGFREHSDGYPDP